MIIGLLLVALMIVSFWIIFNKAGQPGWAVLIPFYNIYVMLLIAKKPWWWLLLILFVPIANIIFLIMMYHAISLNFGKGAGFTVGMIFLGFIFFPILAFGDAKYNPVEAAPQAE